MAAQKWGKKNQSSTSCWFAACFGKWSPIMRNLYICREIKRQCYQYNPLWLIYYRIYQPLHLQQSGSCFLSLLTMRWVLSPSPVYIQHWSPLSAPICASSCFISQVRQRYPCIKRSSEAPCGSGCKSSKRVQLSWQDAWKLSSDLATQEASLSAVGSLGFCSHDITQYCLLSVGKFTLKWFRSWLVQKQYCACHT